jgi:molybdopterin-guanine dinucleotide biosynthesis protein B
VRVFSVVGGCAGKTEVMRGLVNELTGRGLRVSTIKRVPDTVDLEKPGSGTWMHREAGAEEVILASTSRIALLREMPTDADEPDVEALLARLAPVDIVLLEGFRLTYYPKLELVQPERDRRLLALDDPSVVAVSARTPVAAPVPFLPLSDIGAIADFVLMRAVTAGASDTLALASEAMDVAELKAAFFLRPSRADRLQGRQMGLERIR